MLYNYEITIVYVGTSGAVYAYYNWKKYCVLLLYIKSFHKPHTRPQINFNFGEGSLVLINLIRREMRIYHNIMQVASAYIFRK